MHTWRDADLCVQRWQIGGPKLQGGSLGLATSAGGSDHDTGFGVAVDSLGNVVVTGRYRGNAAFGTTTLTPIVNHDKVFVAKLNPKGAFVWAKSAGGTGLDQGYSVAIDSSDNILVTGRYSNGSSFGGVTLTTKGGAIFVWKFDPKGQSLWTAYSTGDRAVGNAIAVDRLGNSYVTGDFEKQQTISGIQAEVSLSRIFSDELSFEPAA